MKKEISVPAAAAVVAAALALVLGAGWFLVNGKKSAELTPAGPARAGAPGAPAPTLPPGVSASTPENMPNAGPAPLKPSFQNL